MGGQSFQIEIDKSYQPTLALMPKGHVWTEIDRQRLLQFFDAMTNVCHSYNMGLQVSLCAIPEEMVDKSNGRDLLSICFSQAPAVH